MVDITILFKVIVIIIGPWAADADPWAQGSSEGEGEAGEAFYLSS